ncbi:MAG: hypothetical protein ACREFP_24860 [Acetobacteraceae bacterium]
MNRTLHAPRAPGLDAATLSSVPVAEQPDLRLRPHPSLSLLQLRHPSRAIWEAVLIADARERALCLAVVDLARSDGCVAVLHRSRQLALIALSEASFAMAHAFAQGGRLVDVLASAPPEAAAPLLAGLLCQGFFAGCRRPAEGGTR